jgi:hypothetical protein
MLLRLRLVNDLAITHHLQQASKRHANMLLE